MEEALSKEMRKGTAFERMVADYLKAETGLPIDRRVKCGAMDKGDIAGMAFGSFDVVIECKNCQRMELAKWVGEAERERENADASFGIVVSKRRGCGEKNVGDTYVHMTLDTFIALWRVVDGLLKQVVKLTRRVVELEREAQ